MPKFELSWTAEGTAVVEADDLAEAEYILKDGLGNLDSAMLDEVDVNQVDVTAGGEEDDE